MLMRYSEFTAAIVAAWCVLTVCHEGGHVIGGWIGGGVLQAADLSPWRLPYSIFNPDPQPLLTLWSGPVLGIAIPGLATLLFRHHFMYFIAYFCLVGNGLYLATAWLSNDRFLDTAKLLEHGCHPFWIATYCISTISWGYFGFRNQCKCILGLERDTVDVKPN